MLETEIELKKYIEKEGVTFLSENDSRDSVIEKLIDSLLKRGLLKEKQNFFEAIIEREHVISTGIGMGIAIPHAKIEGVNDFFISVGIVSGKGIEWNAIDNLPVRAIFLIGGPKNLHKEYLTLLSKLTQVLKDNECKGKIFSAESREDLVKIFSSC